MPTIAGSSGNIGAAQRRKRKQYKRMPMTVVAQVPFGKMRVGFGLHHDALDPRSRNDLVQLV